MLAKSLTLRGVRKTANQSLPRLSIHTTLLGTPAQPVTLRLEGVHFSGSVGLGDATVSFSESTLDNATFRQEEVRREASHQVAYSLESVVLRNTTFTVGSAGDEPGQNVYSTSFSLVNSDVVDTVVDLRAVRADVRLQRVRFTSTTTGDVKETPRGRLTMHIGHRANASDLYTPTVTTTKTKTSAASGGIRQKRSISSPPALSVTNSITIVETTFRGLAEFGGQDSQQAAVSLTASDSFSFVVKRSNFTDNRRALRLEALPGMKEGSLYVTQCGFHGNTARGPGGAVHVEQGAGRLSIRVEKSVFTDNLALSLPASQNLSQTRISKITGSGGALAFSLQALQEDSTMRASADIRDCTFTNNTAENYGGSLYFTSGVVASLYGNTFSNVNINTTRPRIGDILESRGNMLLRNNTFRVATSTNEVPILSYRAERDGQFLQSEGLDFICPKGYQASTVYNAIRTTGRKSPIETLLMYCQSCSEGLYSLAGSHVLLNQANGLDVQPLSTSRCDQCPYGASCRTDVHAKANFWGEVHEGHVYMYLCPADYCCQEPVCMQYDECAPYREGLLCGRCQAGYSESLFSPSCILNSNCSYATWFWAVIVLYGIAYVAFFVFQQEVEMVMANFSAWLSKHLGNLSEKCKRKSKHKDTLGKKEAGQIREKEGIGSKGEGQHSNNDKPVPDGAYLQIFMYYVQSADLLKISILYLGNREMPLESLGNTLKNIFSFNTFGINMNTCLFKDVTAVFKTWLNVGFVVYLFVVWAVFLGLGKLINLCARRASQTGQVQWVTPTPFGAKLTGALVLLALYTYQYFAENSFNLMHCVWVRGAGHSVLFVDGQVECYQDWQYGVLIFTCVYVLPFWVVLGLGPGLLRQRVVTIREFLLSLFLPLLACPFLLLMACRTANLRRAGRRVASRRATVTEGGTVDTVAGYIADPFRGDLPLSLCWEGVIALRRLLLVVVATLVPDVLVRHVLLVTVCYLSLATHLRLRPFVRPSSNTLEAVSLGLLLAVSIMNLLKAAYFGSGEVPAGSADQVFWVWDWVEAVLLGLLPLVVAGFVALAVLIRVGAYIVKRLRGHRPPEKGQGNGLPAGVTYISDSGDMFYGGPTGEKGLSQLDLVIPTRTYTEDSSVEHQMEPLGTSTPPCEARHMGLPLGPLGGDSARCRTRTDLTPEHSFFDPPLGGGRGLRT